MADLPSDLPPLVPDPSLPPDGTQPEEDKSLLDHIADHPKLAGFLALVAFAATFSPKASIMAMWVCLLLAWLFASAMILGIPQLRDKKFSNLKSGLIVIVALGLFGYGSWLHGSPEAPPHPAPTAEEIANAQVEEDNKKTAVELLCNQDSLPIRVPPSDAGHLVLLDKKLVTGQPYGLFDVTNLSDKTILWPDKKLLAEAQKKHDPGVFTNRCIVSNEGRTKLLNVSLKFNLNFGTKETFPYEVIVNPLGTR